LLKRKSNAKKYDLGHFEEAAAVEAVAVAAAAAAAATRARERRTTFPA